MRDQDAAIGAVGRLSVIYTGKPLSGCGGLLFPMRCLEERGVRELPARALPGGRTSSN